MVGGYTIIDLKDTDLVTGTGAKVDKIYTKISGTRAAIMLANLTIDSVKVANRFVIFTGGDGTYTAWLGRNADGTDVVMTVLQNNTVTVTNPSKTTKS